jgi:hypothetical protein
MEMKMVLRSEVKHFNVARVNARMSRSARTTATRKNDDNDFPLLHKDFQHVDVA